MSATTPLIPTELDEQIMTGTVDIKVRKDIINSLA